MDFVESVLKESRVRYREYRCNSTSPIWLASANQLMASYTALTRFALIDRRYTGWHAHHVVEARTSNAWVWPINFRRTKSN